MTVAEAIAKLQTFDQNAFVQTGGEAVVDIVNNYGEAEIVPEDR